MQLDALEKMGRDAEAQAAEAQRRQVEREAQGRREAELRRQEEERLAREQAVAEARKAAEGRDYTAAGRDYTAESPGDGFINEAKSMGETAKDAVKNPVKSIRGLFGL